MSPAAFPGQVFHGTVDSLGVYNDSLFAGGYFTQADSVPATGIARWDGSSWRPVGGGMSGEVQVNGRVQRLKPGGNLIRG